MEVKAWKGGTYGVRGGKQNSKKYFDRAWKNIKVLIDGVFYDFNISESFWTTCPEIRGKPLPDWFRQIDLNTWPKGNPPTLTLTPLGGNKFELEIP